MTKYDINTFTWYDLEPKRREMAIGVSESGGLTFNDELRKNLPEHFRLCASPDKRVLCIVESAEGTITLPKSGSRRVPELERDIVDAGVALPARYVFHAEDGMLVGELKPKKASKPGNSKKPVPKEPRKIGKVKMEHIEEDLRRGNFR